MAYVGTYRALLAGGVSRPALVLDFIGLNVLDPRITFTRGSNATLVDSTGKITYAPANLLLQSQALDVTWTKAQATVSADSTVSPDGTSTADSLLETSVSNIHYAYQTSASTLSTGNTVIVSVYAKALTRNYVTVGLSDISVGSVYAVAVFNLSNGTVATSGASGTGYAVGTTAITSVGNGWYRCSVVCTVGSSVTFVRAAIGINKTGVISAGAGGMESYLGDGSGIYIWGAQLEPVTYQTTPGPYQATTSSAYYGPRFDYDPVTLAAKGLLIEEQRTNLLLRSAEFDNATWTKTSLTITPDATIAPNGVSTADKIVPTAVSSTHLVTQSVTTANDAAGTLTVFAKPSGYNFLELLLGGTGWNGYVAFNLATGAVGSTANNSAVSISATISGPYNGFYRCALTCTPKAGSNINSVNIYVNNSINPNDQTFTGDGTSGIYLWGAQLEAGAFATSYIPTVASTVTRSADVATMTGANFSSWFNQNEGTLASSVLDNSIGSRVLTVSDGTVNNQIFMNTSTDFVLSVYTGGVYQAQIGTTPAAPYKIAGNYATNNFAAVANGGTVATDTSGSIASYSRMQIGANSVGTSQFLNGHIRSIAYFNTRLSNSQLVQLTS